MQYVGIGFAEDFGGDDGLECLFFVGGHDYGRFDGLWDGNVGGGGR